MIFAWILVGIAFLVASAMIIMWLNVYFKEKDKETDDVIVLNVSSYLGGTGRAIIQEKETINCPGTNRIISRGIPKDVRNLKEGETLEDEKIIYEKNKAYIIPKGEWSKDCNIKIILPPDPEDIPAELLKNPFGKMLAQLTEERNYQALVEKIIREGSTRKTQLLQEMPDGEVSETIIDLYEGIIKQITEALKEKKTGTFERVSPSNPGGN